MPDERVESAVELFQQAYILQMQGELDQAIDLYTRSIRIYPTAEAYTMLGWTYRFQGDLERAIAECKNAVLTDPDLGTPYNDIGAYLLEQNKPDEAIIWLEKALQSRRYSTYHYAWCNLGRAYLAKHMPGPAQVCFTRALALEPDFELAQKGLEQTTALPN